jgi:5S rRNA maturation endonuclease (ribonuclease M5)
MDDALSEFCQMLAETEKLVMVEGKKDEAAIRQAGVRNVYAIDRQPLFRVVEEVAGKWKDVVILTDLDHEGKKLYAYFRTALAERGVRVDRQMREFLFRKTKLRQIEGLG